MATGKGKNGKSGNKRPVRQKPAHANQAYSGKKAAYGKPKPGSARKPFKPGNKTPELTEFSNPKPPRRDVSPPPPLRKKFDIQDCPQSSAPIMLETRPWDDYALLDMGNGEKLEQYGKFVIRRPEAQAMGARLLPQSAWDNADAHFSGDMEEEGPGRWHFKNEPEETWPMAWQNIKFLGRFTSFRHTGVFPEQAAHWSWMAEQIGKAQKPFKLLNLFGYTGVASLVAAHAGAEVTHVDASKKSIVWARENQALSQLEDRPIRWICDDAMKFVQREIRRGNKYDGILLDPPKFGRGPDGERWDIFEDLPTMLDCCADLLKPDAGFSILTVYAMRASFMGFQELMRETLHGHGGIIEAGELFLREQAGNRALATSLFCRWRP